MLSNELKTIITNYPAGMVATVRRDGTPSVSPKATFVVVDDRTIVYGNIRSPQTLSNIRLQPDVEVVFLDVLSRTAARIKGQAEVINSRDADATLTNAFDAVWGEYLDDMTHFVKIAITGAELVTSPGYDKGYSREQLVEANKKKLAGFS